MTHRKEQGGVVVFVLVGLVMVGLIAGSTYLIRQYATNGSGNKVVGSDQSQGKSDGKVQDQNKSKTETDTTTSKDKTDNSTNSANGTNDTNSTDSTSKTSDASKSDLPSTGHSQSPSDTDSATTKQATHLPETGPVGLTVSTAGLVVLVATAVAFRQSRLSL